MLIPKKLPKLLLLLLLTQSFACGGVFSWSMVDEVQTAKLEKLEDFMGCWYVIAHTPNSMEDGGINSTECYKIRNDGKIQTTFTMYRDGEREVMKPVGRVYLDKDPDFGVWGMKFYYWGWLPLPEMAYLILGFDKVYDAELERDIEISVVGGPTEDYLWVMAREPYISNATYDLLKDIGADWYRTDKLYRVDQSANIETFR